MVSDHIIHKFRLLHVVCRYSLHVSHTWDAYYQRIKTQLWITPHTLLAAILGITKQIFGNIIKHTWAHAWYNTMSCWIHLGALWMGEITALKYQIAPPRPYVSFQCRFNMTGRRRSTHHPSRLSDGLVGARGGGMKQDGSQEGFVFARSES